MTIEEILARFNEDGSNIAEEDVSSPRKIDKTSASYVKYSSYFCGDDALTEYWYGRWDVCP